MLDTPQWLAARRVVLRRELRHLGAPPDLLQVSETGLLYLLELHGRRILPSALEAAAVDRIDNTPLNHPISEVIGS